MKLTSKIALISFICALLVGAAWAWDMVRVLPSDIQVAGYQVGGMSREEVREKLEEPFERVKKSIFHFLEGKKVLHSLSSKELGLHYSLDRTVQRLFDRSNWMLSLLNLDMIPKQQENMDLWIDKKQLQKSIEKILLAEESEPMNAEIIWKETRGGWVIKPEKDGKLLKARESSRVAAEIMRESTKYKPTHNIELAFEEELAEIRKEYLAPTLKDLQRRIKEDIVINNQGNDYKISFRDNPKWINITENSFHFQLSRPYLIQRVQSFSENLDKLPSEVMVNEIVKNNSEYDGKSIKRARIDGEFIHGSKVKQGQLRKDLRNIFMDPGLERKVIVETEIIYPKVLSQVDGYDFPQLISTGLSSYRYGNHPNRVKNIKLSLQSFQGVVIAPGEEFSFNRATGWITPQKGYTKTKIIQKGRVTDGVGGGVCQSSTTVYRALLNAGLPITERRNHSLDIIYYHEFGYGLDATVYTDARSDLRFINDFSSPLLVNVYFDDENQHANIEFYGTSDKRKVLLTNIPTGNYLRKQWEWKVTWPDREEIRYVNSVYIVPKKEEEKEKNPLEA